MPLSTKQLTANLKQKYAIALGVDYYEIEPILNEPIERTDIRIWLDILWVKLTDRFTVRFYPKIIRWRNKFGSFHMRFEPEIEVKETKHEKIHSENEQASFEFVARKINEHNKKLQMDCATLAADQTY